MSPEQSLGDTRVDRRSDVYSLGCVLYEMLVGEPPYTDRYAQAIIAKRLSDPVPAARRLRETVPIEVDAALQRAMAKDPADRFPTVAKFADALTAAPITTAGGPGHKRRRIPTFVVGTVAIALLAAIVWYGRAIVTRSSASDHPAGTGLSSVAVLPFVALSGDTSGTYLGDGISQELLGALARVPGLTVAGRASSFRFRGPDVDARHAARELMSRASFPAPCNGSTAQCGSRRSWSMVERGISSGPAVTTDPWRISSRWRTISPTLSWARFRPGSPQPRPDG
jgi:serine/threonine-protein kinase